jgi:hypothetical protein
LVTNCFFSNHSKYINADICNFTSSFEECETSSLKLRAEYKREEVTGGWKKLHNDGLCSLNYSADGKKGKAVPLQTLTGPEGSRRLRPPDFKTTGT